MKKILGFAIVACMTISMTASTSTMASADEAPRKPNSVLGSFGEYSLKTEDLQKSIDYWKSLGFSVLDRESQPYPYAILADGQTVLGLHQDKDFKGPLLTYYAPDMSERIKKLQDNGVAFAKILKDKSDQIIGAIMRSPEGQLIFLVEWK